MHYLNEDQYSLHRAMCLARSAHLMVSCTYLTTSLPYSRRYWQELNLAVGPLIAIAKILVDFNLAVL